jgi:hypothetical protein
MPRRVGLLGGPRQTGPRERGLLARAREPNRRDERRGPSGSARRGGGFAVASGPPAFALRRRMLCTFAGLPEMNMRVRRLNVPVPEH